MIKVALVLIAAPLICSQSSGLSINQQEISSQSLVKSNAPVQQFDGAATAVPTATGESHNEARPQAAELVRHQDNRRPIWALAHMVNSIKELDYRLASGANAIEADVTFGLDGEPLWTYHGPPCDCWRHCYQRENFHDYLNHVREIAIDTPSERGQNLSLLFLDLKLDSLDQPAKVRAGQELAKAVMGDLLIQSSSAFQAPARAINKRPFNVILSINHVNDIDLVHNFIHTLDVNNASHLMSHIGFDVGMNDDLQQIESMWRKFNGQLNLWQGDGYTNCLSPFYNLQRLSKAIAKRDDGQGYPAKVYHWTIDLHDRMRESILLGVDAIMSNHPERLLTVLQEPEIAHDFRLATRADNPFRKLTRRAVGRSGETARYQRSANPNRGGMFRNLIDILTSWLSYMREIPLLSLPATLISRSSAAAGKRSQPAGEQALVSITPVRLSSSSEYKVDNGNATANRSALGTDQPVDQEFEYQPPWYVSVASNLLVSALKSFLPT